MPPVTSKCQVYLLGAVFYNRKRTSTGNCSFSEQGGGLCWAGSPGGGRHPRGGFAWWVSSTVQCNTTLCWTPSTCCLPGKWGSWGYRATLLPSGSGRIRKLKGLLLDECCQELTASCSGSLCCELLNPLLLQAPLQSWAPV